MRVVLLFVSLLFFLGGCASKVVLPSSQNAPSENVGAFLPQAYTKKVSPHALDASKLHFLNVGDKNAYDIVISKALKQALDAYLGGDGKSALDALAKELEGISDAKERWYRSFLKVKILVMMGQGADALEEVKKSMVYERAFSKTHRNSLALRGEVKVWLEDYKGAQEDFYHVLHELKGWELPLSYLGPPSNMSELIATTTAQLRSYTGMAALLILQGKYKEGLWWAKEAEARFNSAFYVSEHPLYGMFVNFHLDTFYGRAMNLAFLASAKTALKEDEVSTQKIYNKALDFFDAISYAKGLATVFALRARAYNQSGQYDKCNEAALLALDVSLKQGMLDFVWRIEGLRGETLFLKGEYDASKKAYLRAFETVNLLSTSMQSDGSKRIFGVGKESITQGLLQFLVQERDYSFLFEVLEKSRARAFVDLLASTKLKEDTALKAIYTLDKAIQKQQLLNSARGQNPKAKARLKELLQKRKGALLALSGTQGLERVSLQTRGLKELQEKLKAKEALAYFLPSKEHERIPVLIMQNEQVRLISLTRSYAQLQEQLERLRQHLGFQTQSRGLKRIQKVKSVSGLSLSVQELNELFGFFKEFSKLYVVPSKSANFVPWGLLEKDFSTSVLVNGSWLVNTQKEKNVRGAVVVGDPLFYESLPQLQGAKEEALSLARRYNTQALIGKDATFTKVKEHVGAGVRVLHFATHAVFDKGNPLASRLFLSGEGKAFALSAKYLYENPLKAELVVLSACESGIGEATSDEDLLGLMRSFYLAGSKTILSSLWPVEDAGTKAFMLAFHELAKTSSYSQAWRGAKEALKAQGYAPWVYGAFVLHGLD